MKAPLFLALLFVLSSCALSDMNQLRVSNDEYKKERRTVLKQSIYVSKYDAGLESSLIDLKLEKVEKDGAYLRPVLNLTIKAKVGYSPDNELFVKVDGQVYQLQIQAYNAYDGYDHESSTNTETKTTTTTKKEASSDSSKSDKAPKVTTTTDTEVLVTKEDHEYNYSTYQMWATFDEETVEAILNAEKVNIRCYLNHEPITLKLTSGKLKKWQLFFKSSPLGQSDGLQKSSL